MAKENLIIKQIQPENWSVFFRLAKIESEAFGEDGLTPFNLSLFAHGGILIALFLDEEIVGEAQLFSRPGTDKAFLFGLAVAKQYRGKGYGKLLLQHIIERLTSYGCQQLELTVASENQAARHLYEKLFGFSQTTTTVPSKEESAGSSTHSRLILRKDL